MSAGYSKWPILPAIKPFQKYGQSGHRAERDAAAHVGASPTTSASSAVDAHRGRQPRPRRHVLHDRRPGPRPAEHGRVAVATASGCETDDLPAFVVMTSSDKGKTCGQLFFDYYWGSGFLPSRYQGVRFRNTGDPVPYLANPPGMSRDGRRALLDDIGGHERRRTWPTTATPRSTPASRSTRWRSGCRRACRTCSTSRRSRSASSTCTAPTSCSKGTFANNCLIARRLLERGVAVRAAHARRLGPARQPVHAARAAVQGHRPAVGRAGAGPQGARAARRHAGRLGRRVRPDAVRPGRPRQARPAATTSAGRTAGGWPAAASSRGTVYGATDDFAWNIASDPVHVHDMQATILHLLRHRPHDADLPLPGPPVPADRRPRQGGQGRARVRCDEGYRPRRLRLRGSAGTAVEGSLAKSSFGRRGLREGLLRCSAPADPRGPASGESTIPSTASPDRTQLRGQDRRDRLRLSAFADGRGASSWPTRSPRSASSRRPASSSCRGRVSMTHRVPTQLPPARMSGHPGVEPDPRVAGDRRVVGEPRVVAGRRGRTDTSVVEDRVRAERHVRGRLGRVEPRGTT